MFFSCSRIWLSDRRGQRSPREVWTVCRVMVLLHDAAHFMWSRKSYIYIQPLHPFPAVTRCLPTAPTALVAGLRSLNYAEVRGFWVLLQSSHLWRKRVCWGCWWWRWLREQRCLLGLLQGRHFWRQRTCWGCWWWRWWWERTACWGCLRAVIVGAVIVGDSGAALVYSGKSGQLRPTI
ncbi:hypothetical protein DPMN_177585 [Dreissena polymorpha]|uniref:Uncharacterized protein n=1 Tax=Dreissena polymorpha TaxID=45954 RepID=A0A9D4E914_DREPO|nr:hypothetical protein DPMN_177585 [Dreissena polymorpha]